MYFCGIDVAKYQHAALVMDDKGQVVQPAFSFDNSRAGFDKLATALAELSEPVTVGLEATGHYWLALYDDLTRQGYPVTVINPLQVAAYRRSGIRKAKTDLLDALWIADFLRIGNLRPTDQDLPVILQLRELGRFRFWLTDQIGDCKRKILCILDRVFPEYETLFSSVFLKSSSALLKEAVSAQEIADFDLAELSDLLRQASRGRFGQPKAEAIQNAARQSVGVGFLVDAVRVQMHCLLQQIDLLQEQVAQLDHALAELMDQIPQHITSIPGIGLATGAVILGEIGDVHRFDSVDKLVAYAGIDPAVYRTGQFQASQVHMSKRGSPYLRHASGCPPPWPCSMILSFKPSTRPNAEGKHRGTVIEALCGKLLARIHIILTEQRPYVIR
jgi:transposase